MRLLLIIALFAIASSPTADTSAALVIDVGNPRLEPYLAGQRIEIFVSDDDPARRVTDLKFYFEMFKGDNPTIPVITAVDIVGPGTIFAGQPQRDTLFGCIGCESGNPSSTGDAQFAMASTNRGDAIHPHGRLAYVTFDTTNVGSGTYSISLSGDYGYTFFDNNQSPDSVVGTTLTVSAVPEPSAMVFGGLFAGGFIYRRRSQRKRARGSRISVSPNVG